MPSIRDRFSSVLRRATSFLSRPTADDDEAQVTTADLPNLAELAAGDFVKHKTSVKQKPMAEKSQDTSSLRIERKELEIAYLTDSLVFNIVTHYINHIAYANYKLDSPNSKVLKTVQYFFEMMSTHSLEEIKETIVRDSMIFGDSYFEVLTSPDGKPVDFIPIDPKMIDYQRDGEDKVIISQGGLPKGWIIKADPDDEDGRKVAYDRILNFWLWEMTSDWQHIGPTEVAYNSIVRKQNLEEAMGESAFRSGFPVWIAELGDEMHRPPDSAMAAVQKDLDNIGSITALTVPYYYKVRKIDGTALQVAGESTYFNKVIAAAYRYPIELAIPGVERARGYGDIVLAEHEEFVEQLQRKIGRMIERTIFRLVVDAYYEDGEDDGMLVYPKYFWKEDSYMQRMGRSRRYASYARAGLLTWDIGLENYIRKLEGLPLKETVEAPEKEAPKEQGRPPEGED